MKTHKTYEIIGTSQTITFHGEWDNLIDAEAHKWARENGVRIRILSTKMY